MTQNEFNEFITSVINEVNKQHKERTGLILAGELTERQYAHLTGVLYGSDIALSVLIDKAKKVIGE